MAEKSACFQEYFSMGVWQGIVFERKYEGKVEFQMEGV